MGQKITAEMSFVEVMEKFPGTIDVFKRFDLDCPDCQLAEYENIEQGCHVHGVDLTRLLDALNKVLDG